MTEIKVNSERFWGTLMKMAEIGETPNGGSHRLTLSQDDEDGRKLFLSWCAKRGFSIVNDQIGNLFVRRDGVDQDAPPVVIGSHLDTQPNGGRFDGVLGVLAGLEVLETLEDQQIATHSPVEIAVWTNEEGARFQPAMMGSGVHCGVHTLEETLMITDATDVSVGKEIENHGYGDGIEVGSHQIGCYVELHIEQGPVLEEAGKTIGIVTGGQAIRWYEVMLRGLETHAGPVPMAMRRDPMPSLARLIDLVYGIGTQNEASRATIGVIETRPGSINVMPGQIRVTVDLRHPQEEMLDRMHAVFIAGVTSIDKEATRADVSANQIWHSPVVRFDEGLVDAVRKGTAARGYQAMELVSGAGHDAFHLARMVPSTMIFVPCRDGLSHNEAEYTAPEHADAGANVLLDVVLQLAKIVPPK